MLQIDIQTQYHEQLNRKFKFKLSYCLKHAEDSIIKKIIFCKIKAIHLFDRPGQTFPSLIIKQRVCLWVCLSVCKLTHKRGVLLISNLVWSKNTSKRCFRKKNSSRCSYSIPSVFLYQIWYQQVFPFRCEFVLRQTDWQTLCFIIIRDTANFSI